MGTLTIRFAFSLRVIDNSLDYLYAGLERQAESFRNKAYAHRKRQKYAFAGQLFNAANRLDLYRNYIVSASDSNFDDFNYTISQNFGVQAKNY